jgi:AraC-like DNA-binding protein
MTDPLSQVIGLLQPRAVYSKRISGAGRWAVRYSEFGQPSFCAVLEGRCRLAVDGQRALTLEAGDFVLLPATPSFIMSGFEPVRPERIDPKVGAATTAEARHGRRTGRPDVRLLGGYFAFDSPDAALMVSLLPALVHVRAVERFTVLVRLVAEETREQRSGSELVLRRLVEVLLIEALRSTAGDGPPTGLLRGLADARLAPAIRQMHAQVARSWTVAQLAKTAGLSRSAFFERFHGAVGLSPIEYLLGWRMAVARDLLRRHHLGIGEVAERVGYASASTFSTAFSRHVGQSPSRYARGVDAPARGDDPAPVAGRPVRPQPIGAQRGVGGVRGARGFRDARDFRGSGDFGGSGGFRG